MGVVHSATDKDHVGRRVAGIGPRAYKSAGGLRPTTIAGGGGGGGGAVTVTSITPSNGVPTDTVVIAGTNFQSGQSVLINGVSFDSIVYDSSTQITAAVPSGVGSSGIAYDISVAGVTLSSAFTWYAGGALFESDFGYTTGTGSSAVRDNTKWHVDVYNPSGYLNVVSAAGLTGWPTTNALRVTRATASNARAWTSLDGVWSAPSTGNSLYFRVYLYVAMTTNNSSTENSHHPCESVYQATGGSFTGDTFDIKFAPIGNNQFDLAFWVYNGSNPSHYAFKLLTAAGVRQRLSINTTYRLEWKLTRTATNTYAVEIRVYDGNGDSVATGGYDWRSAFSPYPLVTATDKTIADAQVVQLRIGSNGGTWANGSDEYFYWGGVMVRADTWCGAY